MLIPNLKTASGLLLHKDLREIDSCYYRGVPVGVLHDKELNTRKGQEREQQNLLINKEQLIKNCLLELKKLSVEMSERLSKNVFDEKTKKLINSVRVILDLEGLGRRVKLFGSAYVSALGSEQFLIQSKVILPNLGISDSELRLQYRSFLDKLELHVDSLDEDEMRSLLLLKDFLGTKLELYKGVEMIVHLMASAATAMSVESLVESWISVYEAHKNKHRPISNDRAEKEISVAVNGPEVQNADSLILKAMKMMFSKYKSTLDREGHFIRRSGKVKDLFVSESVDRYAAKPMKIPFMI